MRLRHPAQWNPSSAFWSEWRAVLWTRKKLILSLFGLFVVVGASVFAWRPPLYEASMKILVTQADDIQSERELLTSRAVLDATPQSLPTRQTEREAARLKIEPVANSRVLKVNYQAETPEQAAQFLQALYRQYSAYRQQLQAQTRPETALRARSADFNQKLDETTQALKQLEGVTDATTQQELLLKQLYDVQKQAEAAQIERRELEQRTAALRTQLVAQPEQVETGSVTKYVTALDKMKEELLALELQRTELRQKYQPQHRLLRDLEQRITQTKELIAREEQNPPRERSFARNETRQRVNDDLLKAEAELAALKQREQRLSALVHTYQTQLSAFNVQSFKKSDLERTRAMNEEAWLRFEQKAQEAEINAVLQQAREPAVSLAEAPRSDPRPINAPQSWHWASLLFVGLVVSVSGAIVAEGLQPRLRSAAGVQRRLGLDVLASLPARTTREP